METQSHTIMSKPFYIQHKITHVGCTMHKHTGTTQILHQLTVGQVVQRHFDNITNSQ